MAFLNVIITEELYDKEFVDCWCWGFDELAEQVKDSTPEWAAEICWLETPRPSVVPQGFMRKATIPPFNGALPWTSSSLPCS